MKVGIFKMSKKSKKKSAEPKLFSSEWLKLNKLSIIILLIAAVIFVVFRCIAVDNGEQERGDEYAEYEKATVTAVLTDSTEPDDNAEGGMRGEQQITAVVNSGQYEGETLLAYNYANPLFGTAIEVGDDVVLLISTYKDGTHTATVYEYNREIAVAIIVALFLLVTILVGGKTGAKSLIGLILTLICIFFILIPLLMKGYPTLLTVFLMCAYVAVVCFVILGGVRKKTVCAALGTIAGVAIALLFALAVQSLAKVDGYRTDNAEALLQLRQGGSLLGIKYLLVGGIVISALGAVMDVAMSISSALSEIHTVDPTLGKKELFRSGMNIGRDMVGTMTNTLILAFIGSSFSLVIYLYSLGLETHQLLSSAYVSLEVISGIASSIGVILSVPITAIITSVILDRHRGKN